MYEVFSISYGWDFSHNKDIRELIEEDYFDYCGGLSSDGESAYIGIDISCIDCGITTSKQSLFFNSFVTDVNSKLQKELKHDTLAKDLSNWRNLISQEALELFKDSRLSKTAYNKFMAEINKEPQLFWTYSTS